MFVFSSSERTGRPDAGPPEPYRSQSMAILPDKSMHHSKHSSDLSNHPHPSAGCKYPIESQRKSTSRSSTGRARSTRAFRESIRSAVPDTSIITMAKRPDQGGKGKEKTTTTTRKFVHLVD